MSREHEPPAESALHRSPLGSRHTALGAKMTPFAGWLMPLQFEGIVAEHTAVREHAGIFDVSHMGRVRIQGPDAAASIRSVTTYDVTRMAPGTAHYSLYCNHDGGIADDVFIYRVAAERWLIVHNASQAALDYERVRAAAHETAADVTAETGMVAVQGPEARNIATEVLGQAIAALEPRRCCEIDWQGERVLVGRTGYTGEDGVECIMAAPAAPGLWDAMVKAGAVPAGLGARDTLRTEAALPLYGQDIDLSTNPFEAGLGRAVSLDDTATFTGRDALVRLKQQPQRRKLSCLRLTGRGVPRPGYPIFDEAFARPLAHCTSGAYSPTLRTGIAMAYLPVASADPGTPLSIMIRANPVAAEVVARPFYRRPR